MSISGSMRVVLLSGYGGIEKLAYRDDIPIQRPAAGEVLIKVGACGIVPAVLRSEVARDADPGWWAAGRFRPEIELPQGVIFPPGGLRAHDVG